jgi:hypothetical protein
LTPRTATKIATPGAVVMTVRPETIIAGRQQTRDGRRVFEAQMLKLGAIAFDGTASAQTVADQLLTMIFGDPPDQSHRSEPAEP